MIHNDGNLTRWKNKASSQHDALLASGNVKYLPNGLGAALPTIDTSNGQLSLANSNENFDEWEQLTISMVYKWTKETFWDGAIWKASSTSSPTKGYSIAKMNTSNGQGIGFWYGANSSSLRLNGTTQSEAMEEQKVLTVVCDGLTSSVKLFIDGTSVGSATNFPAKLEQAKEHAVRIGGDHLFSEILIYADALDSTERGSLESYLLSKWGKSSVVFNMDQNGTFRTSRVFDYETNDHNYSITVWATDKFGASFDKNFTVSLANVVEDLDGDGTENFYDNDIDGDGLTNAEERLYGSDPWDGSSVNRPASDINASNLSIVENSAIGSVVGEFNATDPDGDTNHTFTLIPYPPKLWLDAADATGVIHADGNLSRWKNKASTQYDALLTRGNVKYLPSGLGGSLPAIDTSNGGLSVLDSNISFDGWEKLSISMAYKWTSRSYWDYGIRKSPNNDIGYSISKMNTGAGQGTGFWYGVSSSAERLTGTVKTEAMDAPKVLTVVGDGSSGSVELFVNGDLVRSATNFPTKIDQTEQYDLKIEGDFLYSEILIYENALNENERDSVESFLLGKWVPGYTGFSVDHNGTLRTSSSIDYESGEHNHTITVWATDQLGATYDKNFTITIINDATEDHDGDGFTDDVEIEAGSDPDSNTSIPGLDYGLVAWYPLDGNASDMSGNGNHGTVNGATLGTDRHGVANKAYSFDGVDDLIEVSDGGALEITENLSVFLWYKNLDDRSLPNLGLISKSDPWVAEGWRFWTEGSNHFRVSIFGSTNDDRISQAGFSQVYNTWKHLGFVFSNQSVKAYQDSTLGFSLGAPSTIGYGNGAPLRIGKVHNKFFTGLLDDVRIYNRALPADEVSKLYQLEKPKNPPRDLNSTAVLVFQENQPVGTIIGEFNATDPDGDAVTYHFVNGENNNSLFTLDTNGTLKTAATTFDYEINATSYTITVQAKDELNATTEGNFTVSLLNVNEPPVSQNLGNTLYLLENQPVGTVISDLNFSDPEGDSNVSFSLIHSLPNDLNLTLWLDASETSTISETNGAISKWSDKSGKGNHATQTTILKQPIFDDTNQSVFFDGANDHLSVSGFNPSGSMSIYAIFANTREVLPSSGHVVDVLFTVTGGGGPGWSIESFNTYGVRTDRKIYFYKTGESTTWFLNGTQGTNSHTIGLNEYVLLSAILPNASADLGPLRIGTFRDSAFFGRNTFKEIIFCDTAHSEEQRIGVEGYLSHKWGLAEKLPITHTSRIFSIDANGTLSTNRSFDYESNQSTHTIRISAKDDGGAVTEGNYTVSLLNINEPPHDLNSTAVLEFQENQPVGTIIGEFNATDPDGDAITYHFVSGENNNSLFTLDTNGTLKTATTFDYESNSSSYTITVQAKDEQNATTEGNLTVTLQNANEPPEDLNSRVTLTFQENQPIGTIIGEFNASDPDGDIITYSLGHQFPRNLNPSLWLDASDLTEAGAIWADRSDAGNDATKVGASVLAEHQPSGLNVMRYSGSGQYHQFDEITDIRTVFWVLSEDSDATGFGFLLGTTDPNANGKWHDDGNGNFFSSSYADPKVYNGAMRLNGVIINGKSTQKPHQLSVVSHVTTGNVNATNFSKDRGWNRFWKGNLGELIILNKELSATEITSVEQYLGAKWNISVAGAVHSNEGLFSIDQNGTLRTASTFDYESNATSYTITVQAKDEYNATTGGDFTVTLVDQNEAPYDLNSTAALRVLENQPVGTLVGQLEANDQDEGDQVSYRLVRDREHLSNELFTLDENGTLSTAGILDYEQNASLFIRAKVLDQAGLFMKNGFVIEVLNVVEDLDGDGIEDAYDEDIDGDGFSNEEEIIYGSDPIDNQSVANAAPDLLELNGTSIEENQPVGTEVGQFRIGDPDENAVLALHLLNEQDSVFSLDVNGTLRTKNIFDYESDERNFTVSIRLSDEHNFSLQKTFLITVEDVDDMSPVIVLHGESNLTHEAGTVYLDANASWSDNVDGQGVVYGVGDVNVGQPGTYVLSYNYTDDAGNLAETMTRRIEVMDRTSPVIVLHGESNLTHEAGTVYLDANASWSDAVDGQGVVYGVGDVNVGQPGTYVLSYNYTDDAGNSAQTMTRRIEVMDRTSPVIVLHGESNLTHEAGTVYLDANASWSDTVDGQGVVYGVGDVNVGQPGTYVLSYNYTDDAGNSAQTMTRRIEVMDRTSPVIVLHGESNLTHEAGTVYLDANASWSDAVDGQGVVYGEGDVNVGQPGTYVLSYNYTDDAGNSAQTMTRRIEVMDRTSPVIVLHGESNLTHEAGTVYLDANASWSDAVDGQGVVYGEGDVNVGQPGTYVLSYNYTDDAGNSAETMTRRIEVMDRTSPVIVLDGESNLTHEAGTVYLDANASWSDAVDGQGVVYGVGDVNVGQPGTYVLSYNYTDDAGNSR